MRENAGCPQPRELLHAMSDIVMAFGPDLRLTYVNRGPTPGVDLATAQWVGKTLAEVGCPPPLAASWEEGVSAVLDTGVSLRRDLTLDLPDDRRCFEARMDPVIAVDGSLAGVLTVSRDDTERHQSESALRESESLLRVILDGSRDGTTIYGPDMRMGYVNARVVELTGVPAEEWVGRTMEEMGYPSDVVDFWTGHIHDVFRTGRPGRMQYEIDNADGHRWYEANLSPRLTEGGVVTHVISTNRDITEWVSAQQALRELATHDPLTGLANRASLLEEIDRALSSGRRSRRPTAVLMVDLDRFKYVNDSLGHAAGDDLIQEAAKRLTATVRAGDLVGRTGGDEFLIVMRDLDDPGEAVGAAERLVEAFRHPFSAGDVELFSTASIGVAVSTDGAQSADLLREADSAMYVAKSEGRDRVSVFNEDLRAQATLRLSLEGDLRRALERGQLAVWYQPEIDLRTGSVIAVEALLRWQHPSGKVLTADRFVDVAEETGLILEIGDWVLREACAQVASWFRDSDAPSITLRVNVSALQLAEGGLLDALDAALAHSGLDPSSLCLELTETTLLRETPAARDNLRGISDRGIRIAIDDFGTGYASLTYLHRYPIDVLKIDRSFISEITMSKNDHRLVAGLIALADHLGMQVTAEGVETHEQARSLRDLGCPGAQGHLFSPAVPAEVMVPLLGMAFPHG